MDHNLTNIFGHDDGDGGGGGGGCCCRNIRIGHFSGVKIYIPFCKSTL